MPAGGIRALAVALYKRLPAGVRRTLFRGRAHECPVCGSGLRAFVSGGIHHELEGTRCPVCGSEERHRMGWLVVDRITRESGREPARVLHVAPAWCLESRFRRRWGDGYAAGSLEGGEGRVVADLTRLSFDTGSIDLLYCSHVLEHIVDDIVAMREIGRVLSHDGWALIQVPITSDRTREIPSVTDASERERLYGQSDHVRRYGSDFPERLKEAGLAVRIWSPTEILSREEQVRYGIGDDEDVYVCRRNG